MRTYRRANRLIVETSQANVRCGQRGPSFSSASRSCWWQSLAVALIGLIRSRNADMWVLHTLEVQQTAQALLIATRDAESSVRSFLLSSENRGYLEPFEPALAEAGKQLDKPCAH